MKNDNDVQKSFEVFKQNFAPATKVDHNHTLTTREIADALNEHTGFEISANHIYTLLTESGYEQSMVEMEFCWLVRVPE